jgi:hypothetical protein
MADPETVRLRGCGAGKRGTRECMRCPRGTRASTPALNAGLEACRAPLIARMDADDRALSQRLERQLAFMRAHPQPVVCSCLVEGFPAETVREGFRVYIEWLNGLTPPECIGREIHIESPLPHPSVMMRQEWLDRMGAIRNMVGPRITIWGCACRQPAPVVYSSGTGISGEHGIHSHRPRNSTLRGGHRGDHRHLGRKRGAGAGFSRQRWPGAPWGATLPAP